MTIGQLNPTEGMRIMLTLGGSVWRVLSVRDMEGVVLQKVADPTHQQWVNWTERAWVETGMKSDSIRLPPEKME